MKGIIVLLVVLYALLLINKYAPSIDIVKSVDGAYVVLLYYNKRYTTGEIKRNFIELFKF